ncbi:AraC family transcriptional regulator [Amorphus sp. MBR-141]
MSRAIRLYQGALGRVALLSMDKALAAHAHSQCHVLIRVGGPETSFWVNDTALLINALEPHSYTHPPGDAPWLVLALYIEPTWLSMFDGTLKTSGLRSFFPRNRVAISAELRRQIAKLVERAWFEDDADVEPLVFDIMIGVILRSSRWRELRGTSCELPASGDGRIRRALEVLELTSPDSVDMDLLIRESRLSRSRFFELFRQTLGITPQVYRNALRTNAATAALAHRCTSLKELALDLGFADQAHFTRFLRGHLGITPGEYRRQVRLVQRLLADKLDQYGDRLRHVELADH